jgi:hypothetical protein
VQDIKLSVLLVPHFLTRYADMPLSFWHIMPTCHCHFDTLCWHATVILTHYAYMLLSFWHFMLTCHCHFDTLCLHATVILTLYAGMPLSFWHFMLTCHCHFDSLWWHATVIYPHLSVPSPPSIYIRSFIIRSSYWMNNWFPWTQYCYYHSHVQSLVCQVVLV